MVAIVPDCRQYLPMIKTRLFSGIAAAAALSLAALSTSPLPANPLVFEGESGIEEGAEEHITAGARKRLYIKASGHARQYTIVNRSGGVRATRCRDPLALGHKQPSVVGTTVGHVS